MMVNVAIMKQQQLIGIVSRSQRSDSLPHTGRTQPPVLLSSTSATVCMQLNWKTALDKYTIQVLIIVQQLLITYLLTVELKVSIISFNKQLLYADRMHTEFDSITYSFSLSKNILDSVR